MKVAHIHEKKMVEYESPLTSFHIPIGTVDMDDSFVSVMVFLEVPTNFVMIHLHKK